MKYLMILMILMILTAALTAAAQADTCLEMAELPRPGVCAPDCSQTTGGQWATLCQNNAGTTLAGPDFALVYAVCADGTAVGLSVFDAEKVSVQIESGLATIQQGENYCSISCGYRVPAGKGCAGVERRGCE